MLNSNDLQALLIQYFYLSIFKAFRFFKCVNYVRLTDKTVIIFLMKGIHLSNVTFHVVCR